MVESITETWDGKAVSQEWPIGSSVVVYRQGAEGMEFLMLHRVQRGAEYEGDWAWTVPSGCRFPDEDIVKAAHRELYEEAGLSNQEIHLTDCGTPEWFVFICQYDGTSAVNLVDPEHDRFEWLLAGEAIRRVSPERVNQQFVRTINHIAKLAA